MAAPISALEAINRYTASSQIQPTKSVSSDFHKIIGDALTEGAKAEREAVDLHQRFAKGDPHVGIHEVMIATEKANISFRYAVTLKNKVLDAYREIMQTQI